jgi:hypothetical protein
MTKTFEFASESAGETTVGVFISVETSSSIPADRLPKRMPSSIPESQRYFWTVSWQEGEEASIAALEAGDAREFENSIDLARYLLSPEDAD